MLYIRCGTKRAFYRFTISSNNSALMNVHIAMDSQTSLSCITPKVDFIKMNCDASVMRVHLDNFLLLSSPKTAQLHTLLFLAQQGFTPKGALPEILKGQGLTQAYEGDIGQELLGYHVLGQYVPLIPWERKRTVIPTKMESKKKLHYSTKQVTKNIHNFPPSVLQAYNELELDIPTDYSDL
ncbi:hypothetical protein CR513_26583, partial [Mucuna pruriens]